MGKDMTPRDLHKADKKYHLAADRSFLIEGDCKVKEVLFQRFPNLAFLFYEGIKEVYLRYHAYEKAVKVLDGIEEDMETMIKNDDIGAHLTAYDDKRDPLYTLYMWYTGALDPHFYYNTANNELLRCWLIKRVQEEARLFDDLDKYLYQIKTVNGEKYVFIYCMAYEVDDATLPARLLEYSGCEIPLKEIAQMSPDEVDIFVSGCKSYISDMEMDEARHALLTYNNGLSGAEGRLALADLTEKTPDGWYIEK